MSRPVRRRFAHGGVRGWRLAVALALAVSLGACGAPEPGAPSPPAPEFQLESLGGGELSLEDFRGKTLIVDFWATWCVPCLAQIPILNAFSAEHAAEVAVLGVSVDAEGRAAVEDFVQRVPIDYPVLFGDEALARSYGAPGFPALAVVDEEGRIDSLHVGLITPDDLEAAVAAARD